MKRFLIGLVTITALLLFGSLVNAPLVQADSARLYLSPSSRTLNQGQTIAVSVRINTGGDPVNAVNAYLSYPDDKLQFLSISTSGTAFALETESSGGGGSVRMSRGTPGDGVTGDHLVAKVNFKARVNSGSASVSFTGDSAAVRGTDGKNVLTSTGGGTYSFQSAPAAAPAAPEAPPPPPDTTTPTISDVALSDITFNSAVLSWKTSEATSSVVEYGLTNQYGAVLQTDPKTTDHKLTLASSLIIPGVQYHYRIVSTDDASNAARSDDASFRTLGYSVDIVVIDQKKQLVEGASVSLVDQTATTDQDGLASFSDVAAGQAAVLVGYKGKTSAHLIEVAAVDLAAQTEPQKLTIEINTSGLSIWLVLGLIAVLLLLFGGGGGLLLRRHKHSSAGPHFKFKSLWPFKKRSAKPVSDSDSPPSGSQVVESAPQPNPPAPSTVISPTDHSQEI